MLGVGTGLLWMSGRDDLSGEGASERRWKDARGRHPGASTGGDASRKRKAPGWEPDRRRNAGIWGAGPGEPLEMQQQDKDTDLKMIMTTTAARVSAGASRTGRAGGSVSWG